MEVSERISAAENLYQVLGVAEEASGEEIKKAYYRLVRQFPAHRTPDAFMRLNDAGTTLMDARRRGEYDQNRRSGKRMQILVDQAAASLERDNQKAISLLKSAIALAPDVPRPRHLLAHVLIKAEEYVLAEKQYRWLIRESPRDEALRFKLARVLHIQKRFGDAEKQLLRALQLNPRYHDALMLLARVYEDAVQFDAARDTLERAVANDERENINDLDALLRILTLQIKADAEADCQPLHERILATYRAEANVPAAANRATRKILARAEEAFKARAYLLTLGLLAPGEKIPEAEESLRDRLTALQRRAMLAAETQAASGDPLLSQALKDTFSLKFLDESGEEQKERRLETVLSALQAEINADPRGFLNAVEYVRREYPKIAMDQDVLLTELTSRGTRRAELVDPSSDPSSPTVMPGNAPAPAQKKPPRRGILDIFRNRE